MLHGMAAMGIQQTQYTHEWAQHTRRTHAHARMYAHVYARTHTCTHSHDQTHQIIRFDQGIESLQELEDRHPREKDWEYGMLRCMGGDKLLLASDAEQVQDVECPAAVMRGHRREE